MEERRKQESFWVKNWFAIFSIAVMIFGWWTILVTKSNKVEASYKMGTEHEKRLKLVEDAFIKVSTIVDNHEKSINRLENMHIRK